MITDRDMRDQVIRALGADARGHDVAKIVDDIQAKHGTTNIDNVPGDEFWKTVAKHDRG